MQGKGTSAVECLRASRYLNAVALGEGKALLYNGRSLCMDVVPSGLADQLLAVQADLEGLSEAECDHLLRRGHLTRLSPEAEQEEVRQLAEALAQREMKQAGHGTSRRMVTFILTYQCNLSCAYCYQADVRAVAGTASMSAPFLDDFFWHQLEGLLPGRPEEPVFFQLYGGEPMLPGNREAITRILAYAAEKGISVSTVTNAVTIPAMLDLFGSGKGKINIAQVTLDGEQLFHDGQRFSHSGAPTFDQTLRSVHALVQTGAQVVIRIHVYPGHVQSAQAVVDCLDREGLLGHDQVKVYFWSTEDLHDQALAPSEFSAFAELFLAVADRQKAVPTSHFSFLEPILDLEKVDSLALRNHCSLCVAGLHCVVDPAGDLYECIDDAGRKDRRTGHLEEGSREVLKPAECHLKPYLCDKPECLACSVALFCGGGCHNRLRTSGPPGSAPFCLQVKDFIALSLRTSCLLNSGRA